MKCHELGKSGLKVSRLTLGGNIFGAFCDTKESIKIIDNAGNLGINAIDTANVYSNGDSETIIGTALQHKRNKWIIATKVGVPSREVPNGIGEKKYILKCIEGSLRRLQTDYIDLYQMHHYDPSTPIKETLFTLEQLKKQGKIRHYGVTNYNQSQLKSILDQNLRQSIKLTSLQTHFNILKRDAETYLFPLCQKHNIGILTYGALARGVLSQKYNKNKDLPVRSRAKKSASVKNDLSPHVLKTIEKLDLYAKKFNKSVSDLALAWTLAHSQVSSVIIGVRNISQLKSNVEATDWHLSKKHLIEIGQLIGDLDQFNSLSLGSFIKLRN